MKLFGSLFTTAPDAAALPSYIKQVQDVRGVRVVRLHGPVGTAIGGEFTVENQAAAAGPSTHARPLLIDFAEATDCDFSTVAYLVETIRNRLPRGARVGLINAPPELLAGVEIAKLGTLFSVYPSEAEAISGLLTQAADPKR